MGKPILNGILFQVGWLLCVFYGDLAAALVAASAALIYSRLFFRTHGELLLILTIVLVGIAGDTLLGFAGVLDYPSGWDVPPFWMMTLWLLFATTIPWALRWLVALPVWFVVLCAAGGPLSYYVGVTQSDVSFGLPFPAALAILALLWFIHGVFILHVSGKWLSGN